MTTPSTLQALPELRKNLRSFEADHNPAGWPAIRMRDISALLDELDRRDTAAPQASGQQEDSELEAALKDRVALAFEVERLTNELRYIANADVVSWDDPSEFRAWAQNRARAAILATAATQGEVKS